MAQATVLFAGIDSLVSRNLLKDPNKPDDPDLQTRCASFDELHQKLTKRSDPDLQKLMGGAGRACTLDLPLLVAGEALSQLGFAGSQASKQLSCNVASRELEKARGVKPDDPRVRLLDMKFRGACK